MFHINIVKRVLGCLLFSTFSLQATNVVDYDIIYTRYDINPKENSYVTVPQGEQAYKIQAGADLVLLKPNGEEIILVDCDVCSVVDPTLSFDAKTVYYSVIEFGSPNAGSYIYKIHLEEPYTPIRLTFNDGFDSKLYVANDTNSHDQGSKRSIRDMSPIPLSDGRILFTSNRSALLGLNAGTKAVSVQQLYTMDDHDGSLKNTLQSSIKRLEVGTLHLAQHPIQLKDGRILFSTWQDVATKFHYAMTALFTVNPDGSNLKQFTEPHDHHKNLDHFVTQLPDEQVVTGNYYPSFDFGYGILLRFPISSPGPDFIKGVAENEHWKGHRTFARKGTVNLTPHTTGNDIPAPSINGIPQGKYSMPAVTKNGGLLVSYSPGYVNHFDAVCRAIEGKRSNRCEDLKAGIYLIPDAEKNIITNKNQLTVIKDDPFYNEMWPKPVLSYQELYGIEKPALIEKEALHPRLHKGEASGIVGTSSMYNRETTTHGGNPDPFQEFSSNRERIQGNWAIQGADAGVYRNKDIYGVRIISAPAKPFTEPIAKWSPASAQRWQTIKPYLAESRQDDVFARYRTLIHERWEILGEFPLVNKAVDDQQGNPDTSWAAKIPADTPFLIQAINKNGMTLNSELTWRGVKPGEVRTDCGGCHAHSIEKLDFETTETFKNINATANLTEILLDEIKGININDRRVKNGLWDLTQNSIPVLSGSVDDPSITYINQNILSVEFKRDIEPILQNKCVSCHTKNGSASALVLDGSSNKDPYLTLINSGNFEGKPYKKPQASRYIRVPQARQSLLTWVVWGKRLDGRNNSARSNDIDYTDAMHQAHVDLNITDDEKRKFSRWIDLGSPINFPETDGMGYTDDNQLPVINIELGETKEKGVIVYVGMKDVHSGIDWKSIKTSILPLASTRSEDDCSITLAKSDRINGINTYYANVVKGSEYIIKVEVKDHVGNTGIASINLSSSQLGSSDD